MERYDVENPSKYLRGLLKDDIDLKAIHAFENYVGVVSSPLVDFDNFTQMVNDYMEKPPFNFPNPLNYFGGVKRVTIIFCSFSINQAYFTTRQIPTLWNAQRTQSLIKNASFFLLDTLIQLSFVLKSKGKLQLFRTMHKENIHNEQ